MGATEVALTGRIRADGSLELDRRPGLPEGPVRVILASLEPTPLRKDTLELLDEIAARRRAEGGSTRTAAEIDAAVDELRNEALERALEVEELQDSIRRQRGKA